MTTTYTHRAQPVALENYKVSFGVTDERGREVGNVVYIAAVEYTPAPEGDRFGGYLIPAGSYFEARVQATRNGAAFGASQQALRATTLAELQKLVEKRVAESRKRYTKQYGQPAAPAAEPEAVEVLNDRAGIVDDSTHCLHGKPNAECSACDDPQPEATEEPTPARKPLATLPGRFAGDRQSRELGIGEGAWQRDGRWAIYAIDAETLADYLSDAEYYNDPDGPFVDLGLRTSARNTAIYLRDLTAKLAAMSAPRIPTDAGTTALIGMALKFYAQNGPGRVKVERASLHGSVTLTLVAGQYRGAEVGTFGSVAQAEASLRVVGFVPNGKPGHWLLEAEPWE